MKRRMSFTLNEIREVIATMSRGGHPDGFIPYEAKVSAQVVDRPFAVIEQSKVRIVLEWEEE